MKACWLLVVPLRINRCPLLGSTPWRRRIKLHAFFPVAADLSASGPPADPESGELKEDSLRRRWQSVTH